MNTQIGDYFLKHIYPDSVRIEYGTEWDETKNIIITQ